MRKDTIEALKELAISFEEKDIQVAYELMSIVRQYKSGVVINKKLKSYKAIVEENEKNRERLQNLLDQREIAIIPVGFRCHTKMNFIKKTGIKQQSFPFDSGFFPPSSVAKVIRSGKVNLEYDDKGTTHNVCVKTERYESPEFGRGIRFESSSYDDIESSISTADMKSMRRYLDGTFGYYTLDVDKKYVLAHFNWHKLASPEKSKGISDPAVNLKLATEMLNKRILRMFEMAQNAQHTFFVFGEFQEYSFMQIDDDIYDLGDLTEIESAIRDCVTENFTLINMSEIESSSTLLDIYDSYMSDGAVKHTAA